MIYVIAGTQRSFTNAAMKAVRASSDLQPVATPERYERFRGMDAGPGGYQFNDGELVELEFCDPCRRHEMLAMNRHRGGGKRVKRRACENPGCWSYWLARGLPDGCLVKHHIESPVWPRVMPKTVTLLVLLRDYEEVRQSWAAMGQEYNVGPAEHYLNVCSFYDSAPTKRKTLAWAQHLFDPSSLKRYHYWTRLAQRGWPIDPMVASQTVKPELNRFQRHALVEGSPVRAEVSPDAWAGELSYLR